MNFLPYSQIYGRSIDDIYTALLNQLEKMSVPVFCTIDHSKNARGVGLEIPETRVIIFGNPMSGTPLMLMRPDIALDLPLKILLREIPSGCELLYTPTEVLAHRYNIEPTSPDLQKVSIFLKNLCSNL